MLSFFISFFYIISFDLHFIFPIWNIYKIKDSIYTQTAFINYSNNTSTNKFYITYLFFLITTKLLSLNCPAISISQLS
nr:MAG TPA: hypothetical protein [Caudoviricetes sp.]